MSARRNRAQRRRTKRLGVVGSFRLLERTFGRELHPAEKSVVRAAVEADDIDHLFVDKFVSDEDSQVLAWRVTYEPDGER